MVRKLVSFALYQPLFMVMIAVLFIAAGIVAFRQLPVEAFPDVTDVQTTSAPNLTTSTNTNTCTDITLTTAKMMGFGTTFTTGGAGFTGNVFAKLRVRNRAEAATFAQRHLPEEIPTG